MEVFLMDARGPVNVMLDLETWGTAPGSALRSIGAVTFDPYSAELGDEFYCNIDNKSCLDAGLVMDANTVKWWSTQSQKAQDALLVDQVTLKEACTMFVDWFKRRGVFVWSQGANFDQPLLEAALRAVGLSTPWRFVDSRCTRTAYDMGRLNPRTITRSGTHHNALDDAIYQARCVQAAYAKLGR